VIALCPHNIIACKGGRIDQVGGVSCSILLDTDSGVYTLPRFPSFIMHVYKGVVGVSFLLAVFCQGIVIQLQGVKFQQVRRFLPSITCHCMQGRVFTLASYCPEIA